MVHPLQDLEAIGGVDELLGEEGAVDTQRRIPVTPGEHRRHGDRADRGHLERAVGDVRAIPVQGGAECRLRAEHANIVVDGLALHSRVHRAELRVVVGQKAVLRIRLHEHVEVGGRLDLTRHRVVQDLRERVRVWDGHRVHRDDAVRCCHRDRPRDRRTPVVPGDVKSVGPDGIRQPNHILHEEGHRVVLDVLGARAGRVAALVRCHRAKTRFGDTGGGFGNNVKFAVNIPLGEAAAARVTAYNTALGGFMDAVQPDGSTNEDMNSGRRTGARIAVLVQPNERFSITPRVIYQDVSMDGWNRIDAYNILGNPFTTTRPAITLGERELFTQFEEPFGGQFLLGDLKAEYDFGNVLLTSITSVTNRDVEVVRDSSALAASVTGGTIGFPEAVYALDAPLIDMTSAQAVTEELRLSGATERVNWVGGLFYSNAERRYGQSLPVTGFEAATGIPTAGTQAARDELFFSDLNYDFDQTALFGEVSVAVTERFNLTGGLRWYDFDERRVQTFDGIFADAGTNEGDTAATGVAPRFIASYDVTDSTQVNAQVSKGFRLGGINDPLNVPVCTPRDLETFGNRGTWEDEELWNYEAGTKSTFLGGRGTLNVSGFYMDIRNLQATVTAGSCSSRMIFNVPESRSAGMEFEIAAQPTPLFDFAVAASVADAKLQSTLESYDAAGNSTGIIAGIEGGQAAADHATVPGHGGGNLALADGTLGRLPERHVSACRSALHAGGRPGGRFRHGQPAGAAEYHRRAVDPGHIHLQPGTARVQHPEHPDRRAQRRLGHCLLRQQRH